MYKNKIILKAKEVKWLYPIYDFYSGFKPHFFGHKWPLNRNESFKPFFIVGSGRSGNTLLRRILQTSTQINIPPETYMLRQAIAFYRQNARMPWSRLVQFVLSYFEFQSEFDTFQISLRPLAQKLAKIPEKSRSLAYILNSFYMYHGEQTEQIFEKWGDKTPENSFALNRILSVFPKAQFIHIIRDGVDVVISLIKTKLISDFEEAALHWKMSIRVVERFTRRHPLETISIRYEDLVRDPLSTVQVVCDFLNIKFNRSMIESLDHAFSMGDLQTYPHYSNVLKPISTLNIGKGRRELSNKQRIKLQGIIGRELERLCYEPL